MSAAEKLARVGADVAQLRARLDAAADYARERLPDADSPCSRDVLWLIIQLAKYTPDEALPREVKAAETLWRAALEVERIEGST